VVGRTYGVRVYIEGLMSSQSQFGFERGSQLSPINKRNIRSGGKRGKPRPYVEMSQVSTNGQIELYLLSTMGSKSILDLDCYPHLMKEVLCHLWVPVYPLPSVIPFPMYDSIVIEPSLLKPSYISLMKAMVSL
jgi:hypothetical protein